MIFFQRRHLIKHWLRTYRIARGHAWSGQIYWPTRERFIDLFHLFCSTETNQCVQLTALTRKQSEKGLSCMSQAKEMSWCQKSHFWTSLSQGCCFLNNFRKGSRVISYCFIKGQTLIKHYFKNKKKATNNCQKVCWTTLLVDLYLFGREEKTMKGPMYHLFPADNPHFSSTKPPCFSSD